MVPDSSLRAYLYLRAIRVEVVTLPSDEYTPAAVHVELLPGITVCIRDAVVLDGLVATFSHARDWLTAQAEPG